MFIKAKEFEIMSSDEIIQKAVKAIGDLGYLIKWGNSESDWEYIDIDAFKAKFKEYLDA